MKRFFSVVFLLSALLNAFLAYEIVKWIYNFNVVLTEIKNDVKDSSLLDRGGFVLNCNDNDYVLYSATNDVNFALKCTRDNHSIFVACYASNLLQSHTTNECTKNIFKVGMMKVEWIRTMEGRCIALKYDNGRGVCWIDAVGNGVWKIVFDEKIIDETSDI